MIQSQLLLHHPNLKHAFSGVSDGNMDYRFGSHQEVLINRTKFLHRLRLSVSAGVQQYGQGAVIRAVSSTDSGRGMLGLEDRIEANAFIATERGLALFLCIADCLPMIMFDPIRQVIALVHAGRGSTNLHLAAQVVRTLKSDYGCDPHDLQIAFGPAIKVDSYIFDRNIYNLLGADWHPFLRVLGPDQIAVDNVGYNRWQLIEAGVPAEQIDELPADTFANPEYYSHVRSVRTGSPEGRIAAVVALSDEPGLLAP